MINTCSCIQVYLGKCAGIISNLGSAAGDKIWNRILVYIHKARYPRPRDLLNGRERTVAVIKVDPA